MEWDVLERKSRVLERFSRGVTCSYRRFTGMATETSIINLVKQFIKQFPGLLFSRRKAHVFSTRQQLGHVSPSQWQENVEYYRRSGKAPLSNTKATLSPPTQPKGGEVYFFCSNEDCIKAGQVTSFTIKKVIMIF